MTLRPANDVLQQLLIGHGLDRTFLRSAAPGSGEGAMEVSGLLAKAKALPLPQRRRVAAIMGSLVADAAGKRRSVLKRAINIKYCGGFDYYNSALLDIIGS